MLDVAQREQSVMDAIAASLNAIAHLQIKARQASEWQDTSAGLLALREAATHVRQNEARNIQLREFEVERDRIVRGQDVRVIAGNHLDEVAFRQAVQSDHEAARAAFVLGLTAELVAAARRYVDSCKGRLETPSAVAIAIANHR